MVRSIEDAILTTVSDATILDFVTTFSYDAYEDPPLLKIKMTPPISNDREKKWTHLGIMIKMNLRWISQNHDGVVCWKCKHVPVAFPIISWRDFSITCVEPSWLFNTLVVYSKAILTLYEKLCGMFNIDGFCWRSYRNKEISCKVSKGIWATCYQCAVEQKSVSKHIQNWLRCIRCEVLER